VNVANGHITNIDVGVAVLAGAGHTRRRLRHERPAR
jgi:hypothetical protein